MSDESWEDRAVRFVREHHPTLDGRSDDELRAAYRTADEWVRDLRYSRLIVMVNVLRDGHPHA